MKIMFKMQFAIRELRDVLQMVTRLLLEDWHRRNPTAIKTDTFHREGVVHRRGVQDFMLPLT
eukprot:SAG11_NODE_4643_length_1824_cov_1.106667_2_plen_62_part_00